MRNMRLCRQTSVANVLGRIHFLPGVLAVAALVLSAQIGWAQQQEETTEATQETHSGTVVSVGDGQFTATVEDGERHSHRVTEQTKITIDGESAKLEDLREGDRIQVTLGEENVAKTITVTRDSTTAQPQEQPQRDQFQRDDQPRPEQAERPFRERRRQQRAFLGVQIAPAPTEGVLIIAVQSGGPAQQAGIEEGDIIVSIDGQSVGSPNELRRVLRQKSVDDQVQITVQRDDQEQEFTATLKAPRMAGFRGQPQGPRGGPGMGMFGEDVAWLGIIMQDDDPQEQGVTIGRVYPSGPAARGGLRQGDVILRVNGQDVMAPEDVVAVIEDAEPDSELDLVLRRDDQEEEKTVRLGRRSEFFGSMFRGRMMRRGFEDFGMSSMPRHAMMLEQHRRLAEQHERIEQLLRELQDDVKQLREELQQQRQNGADREAEREAEQETENDNP